MPAPDQASIKQVSACASDGCGQPLPGDRFPIKQRGHAMNAERDSFADKSTSDVIEHAGRWIARLVLIAIATLLLSGCFTRYHYKSADGAEVSIVSNREFPDGLLVEAKTAAGVELKVDAGSVKTHESEAATGAIEALIQALLVRPPAD